MNQQIKRFRKKIYLEALIQCALYAVSLGLFTISVLLILVKNLILKLDYSLCVIIGLSTLLVSFLVFFLILRPNESKIAARLDKELNLNEKVKTMVYYKDSNQPMMVVQREETNRILSKFSPSQLPLRIAMLGFIVMILSSGSFTYSVLTPKKQAKAPIVNVDPNDNINDKIDEIINEVEFSRIDEVIKNKLLDILYEVLYAVQSEELTNNEKLEVVNQAIDKVYVIMDEDISGNQIGEALKEYLMKNDFETDLGTAIIQVKQKDLNKALDDINDQLQFLTGKGLDNLLAKYATTFSDALASTEVKETDELYAVILKLSKTFSNYSKKTNKENIKDEIKTTIETAKLDIWTALNHQEIAIEMCEEVLEILNQIKDILENPEKQPSQPNEDMSGDMSNETSNENSGSDSNQGSEDSSQDSSGNEDNSSNDQKDDDYEGIKYADTETLFDPDSNTNIEYGKLIDEYYNEIVALLKDGNLDPSVEEIINQYFSLLYHNGNTDSDSE